jgi:hypothetical protein
MSSFKYKSNKVKYLTTTQTLDEIHRNHLAKFSEKSNELPSKKRKLSELNQTLEKINSNPTTSTDDIRLKAKIKNDIMMLQNDINKISNNFELLEYISKTGDILVDYYDNTAGIYYGMDTSNTDSEINFTESEPINISGAELSEYTEISEIPNSESDIAHKSNTSDISDKLKILNQISQQSRKIKKPIRKRKIITTNITPAKSILCYLPVAESEQKSNTNIITRASLQEKYMKLIDKSYASNYAKSNILIYCSVCTDEKGEYVIEKRIHQSEGCYICQRCGETETTIIESEIPSHKDIINEKQKYPYKKSNHLKEKLNQFQSKENAHIEQYVYDVIEKDLKKRRIIPKNITPPLIRIILKKYRLTEYYEHLQQIYCKVSGTTPISLPREIEEKIINMFQNMQESFSYHCPNTRSNFLNYSYVLNKLFHILELEQHAKYFSLLKSKDKLKEQDNIWEKICSDMNWKFYSSFYSGGSKLLN